jgi:hypothetical protein
VELAFRGLKGHRTTSADESRQLQNSITITRPGLPSIFIPDIGDGVFASGSGGGSVDGSVQTYARDGAYAVADNTATFDGDGLTFLAYGDGYALGGGGGYGEVSGTAVSAPNPYGRAYALGGGVISGQGGGAAVFYEVQDDGKDGKSGKDDDDEGGNTPGPFVGATGGGGGGYSVTDLTSIAYVYGPAYYQPGVGYIPNVAQGSSDGYAVGQGIGVGSNGEGSAGGGGEGRTGGTADAFAYTVGGGPTPQLAQGVGTGGGFASGGGAGYVGYDVPDDAEVGSRFYSFLVGPPPTAAPTSP